eukprot:scaffold21044_cov124-Isochrysis_galbana.AAC.6
MARQDTPRAESNIMPTSQVCASSTASGWTCSAHPSFGIITGSSQKQPRGATQRSALPVAQSYRHQPMGGDPEVLQPSPSNIPLDHVE